VSGYLGANLDALWEKLLAHMAERFLVYPVVPSSNSYPSTPQTSLSFGRNLITMQWPPDRSPEDFLDFAAELGVRVVYPAVQRFGDAELNHLSLLVPALIPGADEFLRKAGERWNGHVWSIRLTWVYGGVEHYWTVRADWYEELCQEAVALQQRGAPAVIAEHMALVHELAQALAADPEFQRIPTIKKRIEAAPRLSPELLRIMHSGSGGYHLAEDVAREAWRIYQDELIPAEEKELAKRAEELLSQGHSKQVIAGRLGISPNRLTRILARYSGMGS